MKIENKKLKMDIWTQMRSFVQKLIPLSIFQHHPSSIFKFLSSLYIGLMLCAFVLFNAQFSYATNIEAVLDSADGSSVFAIQDSAPSEVLHIDSDGNVNAKGCMRIDLGGAECVDAEGLIVDGTIGIGVTTASTKLHINSGGADTVAVVTLANTGGDYQTFINNATPEAEITGNKGDLCIDHTNGNLYIKTTDGGNTGWVLLATASSANLQGSYGFDADGSDATIALTTADDSLIFQNPAAGGTDSAFLLRLDQDVATGIVALDIDAENTTANVVDIQPTVLTTGTALDIGDANALTTGKIANFVSDSAATDTRTLVQITQDNSAAVGATGLTIKQDSIYPALLITGSGGGLAVGASPSSSVHFGIAGGPTFDSADDCAVSGGNCFGIVGAPTADNIAAGELDAVVGLIQTTNVAFTLTNAVAIRALNAVKGAASTITNQYGVYIDNQSNGTKNWGLYSAGTTNLNYFGNNVGIGTTGAGSRLDITTSDTTQTELNITANSLTTGSLANFNSTSASTVTRTLVQITNDDSAAVGTTALKIQQDAGAPALVTTNGNVGIGYTAPGGALVVNGSVGIGNSAPSTNLHVTGGGRITGLVSCDTIDTDANGVLSCGTDSNGAGSVALQTAYNQDADGSDATIALTTADDSLILQNPAAGGTDSAFLLRLDQDVATGIVALDIDGENTTSNVVDIQPTVLTTGTALDIGDADALTTGKIANFVSNSASTATRNLVQITQDNSAAVGAAAMNIKQDSSAPALTIESGNVGIGTTAAPAPLWVKQDVDESTNWTAQIAIDGVTKVAGNEGRVIFVNTDHGTGLIAGGYGVGGDGYMWFGTRTAGIINRYLSIVEGGNIGIGTSVTSGKLDVYAAGLGAETALDIGDANALTDGKIANFASNSASTATRTLVQIINDNAAAVGTDALTIQQDAGGKGIFLDQNGNGVALYIDSEATTNNIITLKPDTITTGTALHIESANALTTGMIAQFESNSAATDTRTLVQIANDNTAASGAKGLYIYQASEAVGAKIDYAGSGNYALDISNANSLTTGGVARFISGSASTATRTLVQITNDDSAAVGATALKIQQDANARAIDVTNGLVHLGSAGLLLPSSTSLPAACSVGQIYMDTDATSGQRFYACETANNWVLQGDSGTGSTLQATYGNDGDGSNTIISLTSADDAFVIQNDNATNDSGFAMQIDQNDTAGVIALDIDAENTTDDIINISAAPLTTGIGLDIGDADALTSGKIANFVSNSSTTTARTLIQMTNDHTGAATTKVLGLQQDSLGTSLYIDHNGITGVALDIDGEQTTANVVDIQPTVLTTGTALDIGDADALTTGKIANFASNSATTDTRILVQITNDNSAAVGVTALKIQQDSSGPALTTTNGNVGIGTTAPASKLDVNGSITITGAYLLQSDATADLRLYSQLNVIYGIADYHVWLNKAQTQEYMRITNVGNFGIGTVSAESLFEVQGIEATDAGITLDADDGDDNADTWFIKSVAADNNLNFINNTTTLATIASGGNVGIGTTAPGTLLDLATTDTNNRYIHLSFYGGATNTSPQIIGRKSRGSTIGSYTIVAAEDALFTMVGNGSDGNGFVPAGAIKFSVDGTPGAGDMPGRITFFTTPDGSVTVAERMRIDQAGNVGIGTTAPTYKLDVYEATGNGLKIQAGDATADVALSVGSAGTPGKFVIEAGGNVGIGTTGPVSTLDVRGSVNVNQVQGTFRGTKLDVGWAGSGNADIHFGDWTNGWAMGENTDASMRIFRTTNGGGIASTPVTIAAGGNIGIGTTAPIAPLQIYNSSTAYIVLTDNTSGAAAGDGGLIQQAGTAMYAWNYENGLLYFGTNNTTRGYWDNGGRLHVGSGGTVNNATATGDLYVQDTLEVDGNCTGAATCDADVAEEFDATLEIEKGDIIILDNSKYKTVRYSEKPYDDRILGVVSTKPTITMGSGDFRENPVPIALSGVTPVKICLENGPIKIGDPLTSSSIPGVAMKATKSGKIIGISLENYNGVTVNGIHPAPLLWKKEFAKIVHFIDVHWWGGEDEGNKVVSEIIQKQQEKIEKLESENQQMKVKDEEFELRLKKLEKVSLR